MQLHALMHQLDGRAIEARAVTQIAVGRDANHAAQREIKARGRQWPQTGAILQEALSDDNLPRGVPALVRDPVSPIAIDPVKLAEGLEAPRGPEPRLQIPHRALD